MSSDDRQVYRRRQFSRVYHDHLLCPTGREIPEEDRAYDRGEVPRCEECARLELATRRDEALDAAQTPEEAERRA
jgi:hypothetical protein